MKFNASLASFLLAFLGALSGWIAWGINRRQQTIQQAVAAAEKALNEKRDFNHLVNNQIDISRNIANGFDDLEHQINTIANQLLEVKAFLIRNRTTDNEK